MRSVLLLLRLLPILAVIPALGQVNPHTQIRWPANCRTGEGKIYNWVANQCQDLNAINPGTQLTWPSSCTPGTVYNPSNNSCVPMGTGNNPGGSNTQLQFNSGGFFAGDAGLTYIQSTKTLSIGGASPPAGFAAIVSAPAFYSPNGPVDVRAAGALGNGIADDTAAIKAACTAARGSGGVPKVVYLPYGNYLVDDLSPECMGVSIVGQQAGMALSVGPYAATLIGKPGKDILHVPDPATWVPGTSVNRSWLIENVTFQVDDSVDPNHRASSTGATNTSSNTLTTTTSYFVSGDVGKYVTLVYPDTTREVLKITAYTDDKTVTVNATPSATQTGVSLYIPLDSPAFPHRWPGRWVQDGSVTAGSSVITSIKALFSCGDAGMWMVVKGAGPAGADLVAKIPVQSICTTSSPQGGWYSSTVDLGAGNESAITATGVYIYTSVTNHGPYELAGNFAMAWDWPDGSVSAAGKSNTYPTLRNVVVNSKSGGQKNHSGGIFFQSWWNPYGMHATLVNLTRLDYGVLEDTSDVKPSSGFAGSDFQMWQHMLISGTNPFIAHGGGFWRIEDWQLATVNGPTLISVGSSGTTTYSSSEISIPEFENNVGTGTHIAGGNIYIHNTTLGRNANLDGTNIRCDRCLVQGGTLPRTLRVTGGMNDIYLHDQLTLLTIITNGPGNRITGGIGGGARQTMLNGRSNPAGEKKADFLRWNPSKPFNNMEDVWLWPQDIQCHAVSYQSVPDATSESGFYLPITNFCGEDAWYQLKTPGLGLGGHPVIGGPNPVLAATKYQYVAKVKCPSITSFTPTFQIKAVAGDAIVATLPTSAQPCSTGYSIIRLPVDLTPYGGGIDYMYLTWPGSFEIDVAWEGWRPLPENWDGVNQPALLSANSNTTVPNSVIPAPGGGTNTNLGGIQAKTCVSGHVSAIGTDGAVTCTADSGGTTTVPQWLQFYGDGSEGAYAPTGTSTLEGEHWYSSVNIAAGVVVRSAHSYPTVIRSTGACTLAGTLGSSVNLGAGGNGSTGFWSGSGGGGGGGTGAGNAGNGGFSNASSDKGTAGSAGGGAGGAGPNQAQPNFQKVLLSSGTMWPSLPNGGFLAPGGGSGGQGGSSGGAGGLGGGMVVLVCPTINFTGTIDVSGQNGGASTGNNIGAGGGGGGGIVIMRSPALTNSGTINTASGAGGSCGAFTGCGGGGTGGNGWSAVFAQ